MKKVIVLDQSYSNYERLQKETAALDAVVIFAEGKSESALKELCADVDIVITAHTRVFREIIAGSIFGSNGQKIIPIRV